MLRIAYDVVKPILSFHVCTEAEKYFQTPCLQYPKVLNQVLKLGLASAKPLNNIHLYFVSFLHIDTTQVVEILPQIRQESTYST